VGTEIIWMLLLMEGFCLTVVYKIVTHGVIMYVFSEHVSGPG
jgi:hypothetical protein